MEENYSNESNNASNPQDQGMNQQGYNPQGFNQPPYGQPGQQFAGSPGFNQPPYGQPGQQFAGQSGFSQPGCGLPPYYPYYGQPMQPPKTPQPVTEVFMNILLVLHPLTIILAWIMTGSMMSSLTRCIRADMAGINPFSTGIDPFTAMFGTYGIICYVLLLIVGIAILVMTILDIVKMHQGNYPVTGLILFALFLQPGYYVWRKHLQDKPMTFPVIYTVGYSILLVAYIVAVFTMVFQMVNGIMMMY